MSYGDSPDTLDYIDHLEVENERLRDENIRLEAQLTWRPMSEKPEKSGMYFAEVRLYTGNMDNIVITAYFNGERFPLWDVVKWLPIPPAPEGEAYERI